MSALCPHADYDDYFERCTACGKDAAEIHRDECGNDFALDDNDICDKCGYEVTTYTDCTACGWSGIPIIASGAPSLCDGCLIETIKYLKASPVQSDEIVEATDEIRDDLKYFRDRQACLPEWERRFKVAA